jgi:hypothetical protein
MEKLRDWIAKNSASRHIVYIRGRGEETYVKNVAEQLSITKSQVENMLFDGDYDLYPYSADIHRMPHELIEWPIDGNTRWKISEIYKKRLFQ